MTTADADPGGGGRRWSPPTSRRVMAVAAAVLGLTLAAVVADGRRARTGELLVQSEEGDLRVNVTKGGRPVVEASARRTFALAPGEYEVSVEGRPPGLRVEPARVVVARGRGSVVRVTAAKRPGGGRREP